MLIHENIDNYRIILYQEDLLDYGQTMEQIIENLKEASGLCGKPLGKHTQTYDPRDMTWTIFIEKE